MSNLVVWFLCKHIVALKRANLWDFKFSRFRNIVVRKKTRNVRGLKFSRFENVSIFRISDWFRAICGIFGIPINLIIMRIEGLSEVFVYVHIFLDWSFRYENKYLVYCLGRNTYISVCCGSFYMIKGNVVNAR